MSPVTNGRLSSCEPNSRVWTFLEKNIFSSQAVENTSYYGAAALGRRINFCRDEVRSPPGGCGYCTRAHASLNSCIGSKTVETRWKLLTVLAL